MKYRPLLLAVALSALAPDFLSAQQAEQQPAPTPAVAEAPAPAVPAVEIPAPAVPPPAPTPTTTGAGIPIASPAVPSAPRPAAAAFLPPPAPPAPAAEPESANAYGMSLAEAWRYGGYIMWVLLGLSVVALTIVVYLFCVYRQGAVAPRRLMADVRGLLLEGDIGAARQACELRACPFSSIVLVALDCIRATGNEENPQLLRDVVESEGARLSDSIQSQPQLLLDLSAIAPMIGLLGTTLGMLKAFGSVATDVAAAAKPVILAQGVSQAIITTIFGLVVAIPCMAFYAFFRRRASRMVGALERASVEVVTALAARRGE